MEREELKRRLMGLPKEAVIDGFFGVLYFDADQVYREALSSARKAEEAKCREAGKQAARYLKAFQTSDSTDDFEAYMQAEREQSRYLHRAQAYFHRLMDAYRP